MATGGPKNPKGDLPFEPEEPGEDQPPEGSGRVPGYAHDLSLSPCSVSPIPPSSRSTLQFRANQEMEWARGHRQEVFDAYAKLKESRDGKIINGDLFMTLLPSVNSNPELVHTLDLRDMNYLVSDLYEATVAHNSSTGANTVVIMIGVAGIGKSTRAKHLVDKNPDAVHTILDFNGADWSALTEVINVAIRKDRSVDILYVGGDVAGAVSRTVSRFKRDSRIVPMETQVFLHRAAPINFIKAVNEFRLQGVQYLAYDTKTKGYFDEPEDVIALANSDLADPNNNPAGIASLLEESFRAQQLQPDAQRAFLSAKEE